MCWLVDQGWHVYLPLGHSPDIDMVALRGSETVRVQVKTSTCWRKNRFDVTLATRGGNRSWSGIVKRFLPSQCDYLFVHCGDGRRWFVPAAEVEGGAGICLGGPKYAEFEVERGQPLRDFGGQIATLPDRLAG